MAEVSANQILKPIGGTYGSFRQPKYRSVAFGTWKVGEARSFSERLRKRKGGDGVMNESFYSTTDEKSTANDTSLASSFISTSSYSHANNNLFREDDRCNKGYSLASNTNPGDNTSENNDTLNTITITSNTSSDIKTKIREDSYMGPSTANFNPECYSSTEYMEFCMRKGDGIVSDNLPLGRSLMVNRSMDNLCSARTSGYGTCSSTNNDPYTMSLGRHNLVRNKQKTMDETCKNPNTFILIQPNLHSRQRARSFDNATRFAVISTPTTVKPSTFGSKSTQNSTSTSKSRFQATKNFLKKLYNNSTTLPKKLRGTKNQKQQNEIDHFKAAISPFYEIRYPDPDERPFLPYNIKYQIESEDEGADMDTDILDETSASSPSPATINTTLNSSTSQKTQDEGIFSCSEDKSMASSDITSRSSSSTQQNKIVQEKFSTWNDLFGHLKKEIIEMRARDAQILAHLKTVEEQLNFVKGIDRSQSEFTDLNGFLRVHIKQQSKGTYI